MAQDFRTPVKREPFGRQIADALRRDILFGRLRATDAITQEELCERFGTSRIPVRDAIHLLVYEGLIERKPSGIQIVQLTRRDFEDMFSIEASLHALATKLATERASRPELETLVSINEEMKTAVLRNDLAKIADANYRFHNHINVLTDSKRLMSALRSTSTKIHGGFVITFPEDAGFYVDEHDEIVKAMAQGQAEVASAMMFSHVSHSISALHAIQPPGEEFPPESTSPDIPFVDPDARSQVFRT